MFDLVGLATASGTIVPPEPASPARMLVIDSPHQLFSLLGAQNGFSFLDSFEAHNPQVHPHIRNFAYPLLYVDEIDLLGVERAPEVNAAGFHFSAFLREFLGEGVSDILETVDLRVGELEFLMISQRNGNQRARRQRESVTPCVTSAEMRVSLHSFPKIPCEVFWRFVAVSQGCAGDAEA